MKRIRTAFWLISYVSSHPANRGARMRAIARLVLFQIGARRGSRKLVRLGTRAKLWAVPHRAASTKVLYCNPPDFAEMHAWRNLLRSGDLFVDIGANIGTYSLWVADMGCRAIAIEPDPETVKLLRENIELNSDFDIDVKTVGIAAEQGTLKLTTGNDSTNHLVFDQDGSISTQLVPVVTLDSILGGLTARGVKIDVEGAERLVIEGAMIALREHRIHALQIEWNNLCEQVLGETRAPIVDILTKCGYSFVRPDEDGRLAPSSPQGYGADLFAVAPDKRQDATEPTQCELS